MTLVWLLTITGCAGSNSAKNTLARPTGASPDRQSPVAAELRQNSSPFRLAGYRSTPSEQGGDGPPEMADEISLARPATAQVPAAARQILQPIEIVPTPPADVPAASVSIDDVVDSIHSTFPLLEAAYQENRIAAGNQIAAWGAFDVKLKASSESGALGFYETYRNSAGFSQPMYQGGEVFGGYRVGRGDFQPWYQERQTNDGGEFKAGVSVPLARNRKIDARRAELWRANYDRQRADPEVRAQLIRFVQDGSAAYWNWIAAGQQYEVGRNALQLAEQRNKQLERKVEVGDLDPPILQDNLRAIAMREAKLIDLGRKLKQSGVKLSLFLRDRDGVPMLPEESDLAEFPQPAPIERAVSDVDIATALRGRPELVVLNALSRRASVDLAEAQNDLLPLIDAQFVGSQDVGAPSSSKRDKSQFELEAGVFVELPVQRRKALGKSQAAHGKLVQIAAKRQFTEDKIRAEIQSAHAALLAAYGRLDRARESKRLAEYMADVERRKFELGQSDLLPVVLREQYAIEAAESEVDALLEYFLAKADYDAAMARDHPQ
ncbi:TolC family protein [Aureliella helgolandensis]|uniref:TolC family protein n=1 Tax=Aureliella helgolandensis TaxID=2527968 RepID=UPI0011A82267|nr:TolC family protein [Aureliella helgolandensis]